MKSSFLTLAALASMTFLSSAATVNWSAGVDHGFSLANGANLPIGSAVKLGHFRNPSTGAQLSDSEIAAADLATLQAAFIEAGSSTVGSGFTPGIAGHFSVASTINTGSAGLNIAGKQMFVWVLNGASVAASTQHAILYWAVSDTTTNPDGSPQVPGVRWLFPPEEPIPGSTTIDVTDLTTGPGSLAAGARLVLGTYPTGTSTETSASNFGLAPIDAPLAIPTSSSLAPAIVSTSYSATVVAQGGRRPYGFTVTSGTLPAGLALGATTGIISGTPTASGSSTFAVTVADNLGVTLAKNFTIVVAGSPLAISTAATLPSASQNQTYTQALAATGGTAPLTWSLSSGTLPAGLTLATNGTLAGMPTVSGLSTFTVEVSDAGGLEDTETFSLTVLVPPAIAPEALGVAVVDVPYSQTLSVSGGGVWSVSSQPAWLTITTRDGRGDLSGTPPSAGSFPLTVQAVGPSGTSTKTYTLTVLATVVKPEVVPPVFPPTCVSGSFSYTLQASPVPDSFIVLGLPPGLKINLKTGLIDGSPTAAGVYIVRVKAKNARGTSDEVFGRLVVQSLPNGSVGTFLGHIARQSAVNGSLGGRIDLTTTAAGAYTLRLTQGSVTTSHKGSLKAVPGNDPTISETTPSGLVLALNFDSSSNSFAGDIGVASVNPRRAAASGWRSTWNALSAPASHHAGYYTMGISHATRPTTNAVPLGHGYACFTVALDGKLVVKGKTSDGNVITCAGFMGSEGQILVFQQLYRKLGTLIGQVDISLDPNKTFLENQVSGTLSWSKPTTIGTTYPAAIEPIDQDCDGFFMANGPKGSVVQGMPATNATAALLFDADLIGINSARNPDVPAFAFNSLLKPVLPLLGVANPAGAKLTINVADGTFKGTFVLVDGAVKRTVPYEGLIVRSSAATVKGKGYFLAPQLAPNATQKLSGTVTIEQ
jgi:hypothetical protein